MKTGFHLITLLFFSLAACSVAGAQTDPTATQPLEISAFGALTGTYTGLSGGKNLGITAGLDVGWRSFYHLYPSLELRGTYPIDGGHVDAQENVLFGLKLAKVYGRFHPYGDFLFGRDKIAYQNGGYPDPTGTLLYIDTVSNVFSYGGGLDYDLTDQLALKVDAQFQQYGTPVDPSGHIFSKPLSIGIVYRFNFNHRLHYNSDGQLKGHKPPPEPRSAPVPPPTPAPADPAVNNSAPSTSPASSYSPPPPSSNPAPSKPSPDVPATNSSSPQPQPQ